jgi:hypothetical protein
MPAGPKAARLRYGLCLAALYAFLLGVYALVAGKDRLTEHTPFNHFALQAEAWLNGRLDLGNSPPDYAQRNDFALYRGKWFVTFPAFPALLLVPFVKLAGSAERVRDAQVFVWLAPLGPLLLWLGLERLRKSGRSGRSRRDNAVLVAGMALGSVYFFTAVQGSVWFAAHVVAVALAGLYLWCALDAHRPWLAGLALGLAFWTRPQLVFAAPLFAYEAWRVCRGEQVSPSPAAEHWRARLRAELSTLRVRRLLLLCAAFAAPVTVCLVLAGWYNYLRFDDPLDFGYRYLQVAWLGRIEKWGLWHYHYLAKNLGVVLTSLPWVKPFQINTHGLALWLTTPVYLWLLWPREKSGLYLVLLGSAFGVALPGLLYQNTGWLQFGYRFSNDYAVFLFAALALGGRRFGLAFYALSVWAIALNAFGAVTFDRDHFKHLYYQEPSQRTLYQPD